MNIANSSDVLTYACSSSIDSWSGIGLRIVIALRAKIHSGAEVAAIRLALGLRERGNKVCVLVGNDGITSSNIIESEIPCYITDLEPTALSSPLKHWGCQRHIRKLLNKIRPDIIHSNDLPTHRAISMAASSQGIPEVCHHRFPFSDAAINWFNPRGAIQHIFVSTALLNQMVRESNSLRASDCSVVYDGLALPTMPSNAERLRARERLCIRPDAVVVFFAGQIVEHKGVRDLLLSWKKLSKESQRKAQLILIGDDLQNQGKYRMQMQALADNLEIEVLFAGFQKNVNEWLIAADIAVVPSHVEPLGNATLEAMSFGLPVIGTRVGGIPEMIIHESTGLLVPVSDPENLVAAMRRLIHDRDLRVTFGQAARRRCEEMFSIEKHVEQIEHVYRQVILKGKN